MRGNRSELAPGRKSPRCHLNTPLRFEDEDEDDYEWRDLTSRFFEFSQNIDSPESFMLPFFTRKVSTVLTVFFTQGGYALSRSQNNKTSNIWYLVSATLTLGSFSADDGDSSENVTLKMNSRFFRLSVFIPFRFKSQKWANFPGIEFLGTALKFRKRKKNSSPLVYFLHKTWNCACWRRSRAYKAEKCTTKVWYTCKFVVCLKLQLLFWRSRGLHSRRF